MRYTHFQQSCPKCRQKTKIVYGGGIGKDEIYCDCGWRRVLPISTRLSLHDKIGIIVHKMEHGKTL